MRAGYAGAIAARRVGEPTPVGTFYRFDATGAEVEWTVPAGVNYLKAYVFGASGAGGRYSTFIASGAGGYSEGVMSVTPGETLRIRTGMGGRFPERVADGDAINAGGLGGWPGGGAGSYGDTFGGGGGGYSGVFRDDGTPIIIAGGGGGAAGWTRVGGGGGGAAGQDVVGATGGTQSAGGTSGGSGTSGSMYQGADADSGNRTAPTELDSGGGGGGYYGGGASNIDGGGGAGGSGYIGGVSSGVTYAGGSPDISEFAPTTVNAETVAPRGSGVSSSPPGNPKTPGNDGVIWLEVYE